MKKYKVINSKGEQIGFLSLNDETVEYMKEIACNTMESFQLNWSGNVNIFPKSFFDFVSFTIESEPAKKK